MTLTEEEKRKLTEYAGVIMEEDTPRSGCLSVVLAIIVFACLM